MDNPFSVVRGAKMKFLQINWSLSHSGHFYTPLHLIGNCVSEALKIDFWQGGTNTMLQWCIGCTVMVPAAATHAFCFCEVFDFEISISVCLYLKYYSNKIYGVKVTHIDK